METLTDRDIENILIAVDAKFWKEKAKQKYGSIPPKWAKLTEKLQAEQKRRKDAGEVHR